MSFLWLFEDKLMIGMDYLKNFDSAQLWRFFVDGRFHKKYEGWVVYEEREPGSIPALLNGFEYMLENLYSAQRLNCHYLRNLHRVCMLHVQSNNPKTSPGDIRYQKNVLPFFVRTTTFENIEEILELRRNDNLVIFSNKPINKPAAQLNAKEVFNLLQTKGKLNYIAWYPHLDTLTQSYLDEKGTLAQFYQAKHYVQMLLAQQMEAIVERYNGSIERAETDNEKLRAIALLVRELEILHPFPDGNCRVFACILLTQLLIYNGFPPAIVKNPNLDAEVSLDQWVEEIEQGIQHTLVLLKDPEAVVFKYSINDMSVEKKQEFLQLAAKVTKSINNYTEIFLTPERIAEYTSGHWINGDKNLRYTCVGTRGSYRFGSIYFAIGMDDWKKDKKNIREELEKRIQSGVRGIVLEDKKYAYDLNVPVLLVKDMNKALDETAAKIRQDSAVKTVLVTGTEGKTGTKIQLNHVLNKQVSAHAVLNSSNSEIPILTSLINIQKQHKVEINEVSVDANEEKTISRAKTVNPDICFFTNISTEHMHVHKSIENVIKAKSAVVEGIRENGLCIVNSSISVFDDFIQALKQRRSDIEIVTYGLAETDDARIISAVFETKKLGWNIHADIQNQEVRYFLPFIQQHAPLMSTGILLAVKLLGYDIEKAAKAFYNVKPYQSMGDIYRIKKGSGQFLFYDQSRRASISGVRSAFKDLQNFKIEGKVVALLGSVSSVNDNQWTREYHKELAQLINNSQIKYLYTTGPNITNLQDDLNDKSILVKHSDDYDDLYNLLMATVRPGDLLLIQGYMRLNLDEIAKRIIASEGGDSPEYFLDDTSNLSPEAQVEFKKSLVLKGKEKGINPAFLQNSYSVDDGTFEQFIQDKRSYRQYRADLLVNFFEQLNEVAKKDYKLRPANEKLKQGMLKSSIYNKDYCSSWFNNLDKVDNEPKKQLFGSFFFLKNSDYLLFVIVGTINLHIGIAKYKEVNGQYEFLELEKLDYSHIENNYSKNLPKTVELKKRSWGKKWVTIDCGDFIDVSKSKVFSSMFELKNSDLYKSKFKPFFQLFKQ